MLTNLSRPWRRTFGVLLLAGWAASPDAEAGDTLAADRLVRELEGVRYEFAPGQAPLVDELAPRVAALNRDAIALPALTEAPEAPAATPAPTEDGALTVRDFRQNRDAWLGAIAHALGFESPTSWQIECYDTTLEQIAELETNLAGVATNARANRVIRAVTIWNKTELLERLRAGAAIPGFSTAADSDEVRFNWDFRGSPAWPADELAQRSARRDAQQLDYALSYQDGPDGVVLEGRATPRLAGAPVRPPLVAPLPAAESMPFPFVVKPEHAELPAHAIVEALFDRQVDGFRGQLASFAAAKLDPDSIARVLLTNVVDVGLRERVIASADRRWLTAGLSCHVAWRVVRDRLGDDVARQVFDADTMLVRHADLRSAIDLRGWTFLEKGIVPAAPSRLPEAQLAFAVRAVRLMVTQRGEDFVAKLLSEVRKTPVAKTDMRTVAQAYRKLAGTPLDVLLEAAVSVDAVASLLAPWPVPGVEPNPTPSPAPEVARPSAFSHEHSDLAPDPRVTWGRLDNGLRYAILPQPSPLHRASAFLLIAAGTYHEHENERGFAHFVEHMAFNGLRDFPQQTLISRLAELGVAFGPHVNATTAPFTTTYHFNNLPTDDPDALATGLRVLRNIGDGILFEPGEVKQESAVILQESRSRAGWLGEGWRDELGHLPPLNRPLLYDELHGVFDETRIEWWSMGPPIRQITGARPAALRAFYDRWYRPERMVLVVAGDLAATEVEPLVRETFSGLVARGAAETPPAIPDPRVPAGAQPGVFAREHPQETQLRVTVATSVRASEGDSVARRRSRLARAAALEMIERRVALNANFPAVLDAWTAYEIPGWDLPLLRLSTQPGHLEAAALVLDREFRRAWTHGFSARELERHVAGQLDAAAADAFAAARLPASLCAQALAFSIADDVVFMGPDDERRLREDELARLTPEGCLAALRAAWPWHRLRTIASGPIRKKDVENGKLAGVLLAARATPLAPFVERAAAAAFPYTDFGATGVVASRRYDAALETWFVTFANGTRLNLKPTAHERDWVRLNLNFGHGSLAAPLGQPGLVFAIIALMGSGLKGHPEFAGMRPPGYQFGMNYRWAGDHFSLATEVRAEAVPRVLQYFSATLLHPGDGADLETYVRRDIESDLAPHQRTARGVAESAIFERIAGGHRAMHWPTLAEGVRPTSGEMHAWLAPQLASSPLEMTIVGACEVEATIAAVAGTLGALPARGTADAFAADRGFAARTGFRERVKFDGFTTVAAVALAWPCDNAPGADDEARMAVLTRVLDARVWQRLREEMGETYAPRVMWTNDPVLTPRRLLLRCVVETKPRAAGRAATALRKLVLALARDGITEEEWQRALRPLQREVETGLRSNAWWLERLSEAQSKPDQRDDAVGLAAAFARVTRAEINAFARELFRESNTAELIASPE